MKQPKEGEGGVDGIRTETFIGFHYVACLQTEDIVTYLCYWKCDEVMLDNPRFN